MSKYTHPDKINFRTPEDAEYHDHDHHVLNGKHSSNGNGIYNDYTIDLQPQTYKEPLRVCCFKFQNNKRTKFILVGATLVVVLSLILIIVAAAGHHGSSNQQQPAQIKEYGLIAYGPDLNGRIEYNPTNSKSYMQVFNRLEHQFGDYSTVKQVNDLDSYMICNDNTTNVPKGKTCMLTEIEFGPNCHHYNMYGIIEGRPCVLLVLKLPDSEMPVPFNLSDPKNKELASQLEVNNTDNAVALTCQGKTEDDRKLIGENKFAGPPISFHPGNRFPMYFFKWRSSPKHLAPAVMVQFNTIPSRHEVTVRCTAWAENFNNGQPQNSEVYSTEFVFSLHP